MCIFCSIRTCYLNLIRRCSCWDNRMSRQRRRRNRRKSLSLLLQHLQQPHLLLRTWYWGRRDSAVCKFTPSWRHIVFCSRGRWWCYGRGDEEDIKADFATNWVANPTQDASSGDKAADKDDDDDGLWGAVRKKEAEASKARDARHFLVASRIPYCCTSLLPHLNVAT